MTDTKDTELSEPIDKSNDQLIFFKGNTNVPLSKAAEEFSWTNATRTIRTNISEAMNARHVAFLLGSGCSSFRDGQTELGIPTMAPLARKFAKLVGKECESYCVTEQEQQILNDTLGLDITVDPYITNLERLMEVLYSFRFALSQSARPEFEEASSTINSVIHKVAEYILVRCTTGTSANSNDTVLSLYQDFYKKLVYRDRSLPRPWIFSTNYDLFNERAMDRLGVPYCNGFSGTVERRFNPAIFRYSLAEQLDISSRRWTAVDNFVYLCKLHGSVSWIEETGGMFPIREVQKLPKKMTNRVMIYPAPTKQNASLSSPYSDLFREFQHRVVRDQSVLLTVGYSFGDEHINSIVLQGLTLPGFRLIAFVDPNAEGPVRVLRNLDDPRVWLIGGDGLSPSSKSHYFDTFVKYFMPELPGEKVDTAIERVLQEMAAKRSDDHDGGTK